MKRKVLALFTGLVVMLPMVALADVGPSPPGCWALGTNLNNAVGVALVGISVGIVLYSRRR